MRMKSIECSMNIPEIEDQKKEAERKEKEQAWLQLHLWMSVKLQDERKKLAKGDYVRPESVVNALQQYRTLPESEGWKNQTREELEPEWVTFFAALRVQGRTGAIAAQRINDGPIVEIELPEAQVMRNIALMQPEIQSMESALTGQSQEPLDTVSCGYLASWVTV